MINAKEIILETLHFFSKEIREFSFHDRVIIEESGLGWFYSLSRLRNIGNRFG